MSPKDHNFNQSLLLNKEQPLKNGSTPVKAEAFEMVSLKSDNEHVVYKTETKKRNRIIWATVCLVVLLIILGAVIVIVLAKTSKDDGSDESETKRCVGKNCTEKFKTETTSPPLKTERKTTTTTTTTTTTHNTTTGSVTTGDTTTPPTRHECLTDRCIYIANNLKNSIDFSVDPCDNFHEYACGLWPKHHPIPPSEAKLDTMGLLNLNKNTALRDIIEKEKNNSNDISDDGFKAKLVRFYNSCMNLSLIDEKGNKPLLDFLSKFGKWSPLNQASGLQPLDITSLLLLSHQYFTPSVYDDSIRSPLFKSIVKVNDIDSSKHILEYNTPDFPIADHSVYIMNDRISTEIRSKYRDLMAKYITLLGASENFESSIDDIINFEIKVAKLTTEASFIRNVMQQYNLTTIKNVQQYVGDEIDWLRLSKGYFGHLNISIQEDTYIGIRSVGYFKALNDLIKGTDKQIVRDYIIWVVMWKFGSYGSHDFQEAEYIYQKAVIGILDQPARWKKCIADIEQTMEFGLAALYVKNALTDEDKILATGMLKNITAAFKDNLVDVSWMDNSTKANAFKKVDSIRYNIGYPDYVKNITRLDLMYEKVHLNKDTYFENALKMYAEKKLSNFALLHEKVDRTVYDLPPTLVEAYFDPNKNKMVFLAGILQAPFYDALGPMALNYGALGLVVGHEVTHAFDDLGRQFDGNGERKNWWSYSSTRSFYERSNCIARQYSSYKMYGINVNGNLTLGENIADNGGIKVAFMAYKKWMEVHGREKGLPGIPLTMEQLLFVSYGQVWCGAYREEFVKRQLKIDYHAPAKYRIIGPLSNLKEFSNAFNCPLGSRMNPVKKCRVW